MPLTPNNPNPLQDYVGRSTAPMTVDGLVVNGVYAVTGVVNTVGSNTNSYQDPVTGQISNLSSLGTPFINKETLWTSGIVDDIVNTSYQLDFKFNRTTYLNEVSFSILSVPCAWTLYQNTVSGLVQLTGGIVNNYDTNNFQYVKIQLNETYEFDNNTSLTLVIDKSITNTQYNFAIKNFLVNLSVKSLTDLTVNSTLVSGITTQNNLGFVENFNPSSYPVTNINDDDSSTFWKCKPQPTGDSIVYFVIDLGSLQVIDRLYIDPLYTGTVFNLYYSYDANIWNPVDRDFRLKKGIYELPITQARYLKFEFTQLVAEPYNLQFDSLARTINVFPDWVDNFYTNIEQSIPDIASQAYSISAYNAPNVAYNNQIASNNLLGTAVDNLNGGAYGNSLSAPNTTTPATITDPTISYKTLQDVAGIGSTYNPISDAAFITRKFPYNTTHTYKQLTINQTWHQAYFTGIKSLSIYKLDQSVQMDYPDFTAFCLTNPSGTTIIDPSRTTASFRTPAIVSVNVSGSNYSTVSGGSFVGNAGQSLYTKNLQTYTTFDSFKFASLGSDWQPFLSDYQTTLQGSSLSSLGVTTNGIVSISGLPTYGSGYGIWQLTPSGSGTNTPIIQDWVQSAAGGGANLLTTAEAFVISGTGWTGPLVGTKLTNASISGVTAVNIPIVTNIPWDSAYGDTSYGLDVYGSTTQLGIAQPNSYSFLIAASGTGSVTIYNSYTGVSGTTTLTQTTILTSSGNNNLSFVTVQPLNTNSVNFSIAVSGSVTLSNAGFFLGNQQGAWVAPLVTSGLRISAIARVFLPNTNNGTYRCGLYSNTTELAHKQFSNIPVRTWVDIEVPFTLTSGYAGYNNFTARLTQINGQGENYEIALLGTFFNPITWEYCSDGTGNNWNYIITGINNPYALINTRTSTNQIQFRATMLEDASYINAFQIVPNYTQSPYYSTTPINYLGDPKTNELSWKKTPFQRPLFQLRNELHPARYDISTLMNITSPYSLD